MLAIKFRFSILLGMVAVLHCDMIVWGLAPIFLVACGHQEHASNPTGLHPGTDKESGHFAEGTKLRNGTIATTRQFPFVVPLIDLSNSYRAPFCTGSVIGPRLVLTAAHCVLNGDDGSYTLPSTIGIPAAPGSTNFVPVKKFTT